MKKPGKIKGMDYRKEQRKTIRARWVVVAELGERWPEKHVPGYLKQRKQIKKRSVSE